MSANLGIPVEGLSPTTSWPGGASEGGAGLLELGPTMVKRLYEPIERAEAAGNDEARLASVFDQLPDAVWLKVPLDRTPSTPSVGSVRHIGTNLGPLDLRWPRGAGTGPPSQLLARRCAGRGVAARRPAGSPPPAADLSRSPFLAAAVTRWSLHGVPAPPRYGWHLGRGTVAAV